MEQYLLAQLVGPQNFVCIGSFDVENLDNSFPLNLRNILKLLLKTSYVFSYTLIGCNLENNLSRNNFSKHQLVSK